jgi:ribonuclease HI
MSFYAVKAGESREIYTTWDEARPHCQGTRGVRFKKLRTRSEAEEWLGINSSKRQRTSGEELHVYTDGACSKNGRRGACAGIGVYFGDDDPRNVSEPLPPDERHTNNRAELLAIEAALDVVQADDHPPVDTLHLYTDSQYSHKALTQWINNWLKNGWVTSKGTPVENRDLLERIHRKLQRPPDVEWHYVKAHNGDPGNEAADALAVEGAARVGRDGPK